MIGIDTNVLIALAAEQHPHHSLAVSIFERELAADEEIFLSESIAAEFLHVLLTRSESRLLTTWPEP